jgi:hypothetical protein
MTPRTLSKFSFGNKNPCKPSNEWRINPNLNCSTIGLYFLTVSLKRKVMDKTKKRKNKEQKLLPYISAKKFTIPIAKDINYL